ncbi:septum formation family protein [Mycobacteroides chelonae]
MSDEAEPTKVERDESAPDESPDDEVGTETSADSEAESAAAAVPPAEAEQAPEIPATSDSDDTESVAPDEAPQTEVLDYPENAPGDDVADEPAAVDEGDSPSDKPHWWEGLKEGLKERSTHRALLLVTFGGLFIAGLTQALPDGWTSADRLVNRIDSNPVPSTGAPGNSTFNSAKAGDCLSWSAPTSMADVRTVDCGSDHRFEVAESIDLRTFPGTEYGPDSQPPSMVRIQEISQEQCQVAINRYLGDRYDPNSRFTMGMLYPDKKGWSEAGERRVLCGLQLPGSDNQQQLFRGKVAEQDQSKVWPVGTCVGIDSTTNLPTELPVDCDRAHAMEITGTVSLAEQFPGAVPPEPDQDAFIKDNCNRLTNEYMGNPDGFRATTLTLSYNTITLPSWTAGSRQVSCNIGSTLGNGAWSTLVNSAKSGQLLINGQPPVPPPDIPADRLNLPPIPLSTTPAPTQQPTYTQQPTRTQQPTQQTTQQPTRTSAPPTSSVAPNPSNPPGNTIVTTLPPGAGPPPPPAGPPMDGPPMEGPPMEGQPPGQAPPGAPPPGPA